MIQQGGGAGQPSGFKEGEAADGFGGIQPATHQALKTLIGLLQLVVDHRNHLLETLTKQGVEITKGQVPGIIQCSCYSSVCDSAGSKR